MRGLVWFLVTRLSLNIAELVHAYMFEACGPEAGAKNSARPLGINYVRLFGCCSLAIKSVTTSADCLCSNPWTQPSR